MRTTAGPTEATAAVTKDVFCRRGGKAGAPRLVMLSGKRTTAGSPTSVATGGAAAKADPVGIGTEMRSTSSSVPAIRMTRMTERVSERRIARGSRGSVVLIGSSVPASTAQRANDERGRRTSGERVRECIVAKSLADDAN
jgi:hypothetical protein